ncbi:MAG TPA: hypothetical protein DCY13_09075, partial [Verrucomicrobiales bacterium]|nr:hypothetical protein [Verrucomicrobiales bacterium]
MNETSTMKKHVLSRPLLIAACLSLMSGTCVLAADTEALVLKLPLPTLKGTPEDLPKGPNIDAPSDEPPTPLQVPKGVVNVAAGKPVTSSVSPFFGDLKQITDGDKEAIDRDAVEFKKGVQWVQVDLGAPFEIHAVAIWHDHRAIQSIRDVVIQVSDDPEFKTGVATIYNNDTDNSAGFGVGTDREYFEMKFGRAIPVKGVKARYLRSHTRG